MALSSGRGVAYVRCSTEEQAASGLGAEAQLQNIRTLATRLNVEIVAVYDDLGISGGASVEGRPGLMSAIDSLGAGDVLLAHKRDRVARDVVIAALVEKLVTRRGARLVTTDAPDDDSPAAVLMKQILDAFGQFERALIRARTKSAMAAAKARGQRVGRIPFGMALADDGRTLVPNPDERAVLAEIHRLRNRGLALFSIAAELNERGLSNRQGRPWQANFIGQLLSRHPENGTHS
ncbi:recombinase family protein [Luteitalea sp.]|uniref:recombinase family protein n=1 Tax=Luteitalea sp. TaxID=2004800 RepID=UPI0025C7384C|nr:recombinase family protein [Luteitalea sp.]